MCLLYCACYAKGIFADLLQISHACQRFWNWYKTLTFCSLWIRFLAGCRILFSCHAKRCFNVQKWREHVVFSIFTSLRASRHNGVQFFNASASKVLKTFSLQYVLRATTPCTFSTFQLQKVLRTRQFLTLLTWKCGSRHRGVHFLDISTSKSAPKLRCCFVHFDLDMCFAPQQCNFSSLIWAHGSAPAALASLLFDPPRATKHWKNTVFRDFSTFSHTCIFFWSSSDFLLIFFWSSSDLLSSLLFSSRLVLSPLLSSPLFSSLLFSSLTLPTSAFPSVHIGGNLTSKLPSLNISCSHVGRYAVMFALSLCALLQWSREVADELASLILTSIRRLRW